MIIISLLMLLLLSGYAIAQQSDCPKGFVHLQCSYCKSVCCRKPEISLGKCCSCKALLNTQSAIKLYNETQEWLKGFDVVCEKCGKKFSFVGADVNDEDLIICPFCGQPKDLRKGNKSNYNQRQKDFEGLNELEDALNREIKRKKR